MSAPPPGAPAPRPAPGLEINLDWKSGVVIGSLVTALIGMAGDWIPPDWTFVGLLSLYAVTEIVTIDQAAKGFGNTGLLTVVFLYVVAEGISQTGGLERVMNKVLGQTNSVFWAQARMMIPVAILSAFLNNTPIVALMIPILIGWSRRCSISPKKLLIPLSYATVLGGTCTLLGTSTNLVVAGLQEEFFRRNPDVDGKPFGIFDISPYGIPYGVWGLIYILLFSQWFLATEPKSKADGEQELLVGLRVPTHPPAVPLPPPTGSVTDLKPKGGSGTTSPPPPPGVAGRTVAEAGLRGLDGLFLVAVQRGGDVQHAVSRDFRLEAGDVLLFAGDMSKVNATARQFGLELVTSETEEGGTGYELTTHGSAPLASYSNSLAATVSTANGMGGGGADVQGVPYKARVVVGVSLGGAAGDGHLARGSLDRVRGVTAEDMHLAVTPRARSAAGEREQQAGHVSATLEAARSSSNDLQVGLLTAGMGAAEDSAAPRHPLTHGSIVQAEIKRDAPIVGLTIREAALRERLRASVVAVKRRGQRLSSVKLGDVVLAAGDVLLLDVADSFDAACEEVRRSLVHIELLDGAAEREFMTAFRVVPGSGLVGKSIQHAGLRGIPGLFLVSIDRQRTPLPLIREEQEVPGEESADSADGALSSGRSGVGGSGDGGVKGKGVAADPESGEALGPGALGSLGMETLHAVGPDVVLQPNDIMWFAGNLDGVSYLLKVPGLEHVQNDQSRKLNANILERRLVQAVVAPTSPLVGYTVKALAFRSKYDAAIIAIHRRGQRLQEKIGEICLQAGDVLLLDTGADFLKKHTENRAFALVGEVADYTPLKTEKMWIAIALAFGMILTQIIGAAIGNEFIHLWTASMITGLLMLVARCLSVEQARRSISWEVFMTIGAAFAAGAAMEQTTVAAALARLFVNISRRIGGRTAALSAIYIATGTLSEVISNNAAAALMFPVAIRMGAELAIETKLVSVAVMLGASSAFITPFGYQCNLMVFSAGNYRTMEFVRFGVPFQIWQWIGSTVILAVPEQWYIPLSLSIAALALVLSAQWIYSKLPRGFHQCMERTGTTLSRRGKSQAK